MITTGSKYFFGLAGVGLLAAIVYGIITNGGDAGVLHVLSGNGAIDAITGPLTLGYKGGVGDHVGYTLLLAFSAASAGLGFATSAFRDGDPGALAELAGAEKAPATKAVTSVSLWPVVCAFAGAMVLIGLATSPALFALGIAAAAIAAVEWTVSTWTAQAAGDVVENARVRRRLMMPLEVPIGALISVVLVMFLVSRIFLTLSKTGAILVAGLLGAAILIATVVLSSLPRLRRATVVTVVMVLALTLLALGIFGGVRGDRNFEKKGEGALGAHATTTLVSGEMR